VRPESERSVSESSTEFVMPWRARYYEVDQQGVVFNGWYLAWFDEAMSGFLDSRGLGSPSGREESEEFQVVHAEIDWRSGVRWGEDVQLVVRPVGVGTTSFTVDYAVRRDGEETCTGRIVYVCIAPDGSGKRPVPESYRRMFAGADD
jgi:acyl-CoA thioester hydrolase